MSEHGAGVYVERSGCAPIAIEVVPWGAVVSIPGSVPRRFGLHEFAALTEHARWIRVPAALERQLAFWP